MKKIQIILAALLIGISGVTAQSPANRTNKTIVADVLAQLPANEQNKFNAQFTDLASTGEEGVTMLAEMLDSTDQNTTVMAKYALSGLASFASSPANEGTRANLIKAYSKALDKTASKQNKNFLINQLRTMGADILVEGEALLKPVTEARLKTNDPVKEVLDALKKEDIVERNKVLNLASQDADQSMYIAVIKELNEAKPDVKIDILNWIGREASSNTAKQTILKKLEIESGKPAGTVLLDQLKDNSIEVKKATAWALTKIGSAGSIRDIANLLSSNDEKVILLAESALASYPGDINPAVADVMSKTNDAGKMSALRLLALRKSDANIAIVYKETESPSSSVKNLAYKVLKDVVIPNDFTRLCKMLETAESEETPSLQDALIASIATLSPAEQATMVNNSMAQSKEEKRHLYYKVLAASGDPDALATIQKGFNNSTGETQKQAFEALLLWDGPETSDILYSILRTPDSSAYFDRALTAYIRLVGSTKLTPENRLIGLRKAMDVAKTPAQQNTIIQQIGNTGTFTALMFAGKYLNELPVQQSAALAVMNIALGNKKYTGSAVRKLLENASSVLNNPDAGYQREAIRKHLAEMPTEEGYVSLFNGKDLTGWKGLVGDPIKRAKMTPEKITEAQVKADEEMSKDWKVENGLLLFDGTGHNNLCTVKQYGDIEMYIDWRLDSSSSEADAGIYLRGTPQVQIWDIARTNVGAQVGSGGLYNNSVHARNPSKVADNKLGEWNTFHIKMTGDRVTVTLNGEKVVDNVILENYWDRNLPIPAIEQLELQAHGSKVYYRDIYVKELPMAEPFQLSEEEKKEDFRVLFDGTNMHEWIGNTVDYTMDNGVISLIPSRGSGGNLYTKKEYDNFIFRFEFQLTSAANNGLGIRTPMKGDPAYEGMELQILDNDHPVYKNLEKYQYHGSVYGIIPAKRGALKPTGEWNYQEVIANGDHIKITLNGNVIVDGNIRESVKNGTPDKKQHPGLFNKKGHIGFLGHGSPVKFKNIRIKELK